MSNASTTDGGEIPSAGAVERSDSTQQQGTSRPAVDFTERLDLSAKQEFATIQDERAALVGMLAHLIANVERSGNRLTFALALLSFCLFGVGAFIWLNMMQAPGLRYVETQQVLATVVSERLPSAVPNKAEAAVRAPESPVAPALVAPEPLAPADAPSVPLRAERGEAVALTPEPPPMPPPTAPLMPPPVAAPLPPPATEMARPAELPRHVQAGASPRRRATADGPRLRPLWAHHRMPIASAAPARREVRSTGSIRRAASLRMAYRSEPAYGHVPIRASRDTRRRSGRPIVTTASYGGLVELRPRVIAVHAAPRRAARRLVVARHPW